MKTFRIRVTREISQECELEIEGESETEAREQVESDLLNDVCDGWDWETADRGSFPDIVRVTELSDEPAESEAA
jgi:hypothetical protein